MGQATSRTKPSIVAFEALARSPAIEVLCGEWDAARSETIPQPASKQTLKNRLIGSPYSLGIAHPAASVVTAGGTLDPIASFSVASNSSGCIAWLQPLRFG